MNAATDAWTRRFTRDRIVFFLALGGLLTLGICFIYSACYVSSEWPVRNRWLRQLFWLIPAGVLYGVVSRLDYRRLFPFFLLAWGVSLVLLVVVLLWGVRIGGARRWFCVAGLLFQPAEVARFAALGAFCGCLSRTRSRFSSLSRLSLAFALVFLPFVLIAVEPSLGNALTLLPPVVAVVLVERTPTRFFRLMTVGLVLVLVSYVGSLYWIRGREIHPSVISEAASAYWPWPHHVRRVAFFVSDTGDWNDRQSVLAIAGGGAWGKGFRQGMMKMLGYLPRPVAPTDFIFSVIGEEAGFLLGTLPVLLLYGALIFVSLSWAERAPDSFGRSLCIAYSTLFCTHIGLNIGMTVRLVPVVGLPLPFLSYGGTFLVCSLGACGLMASVATQAAREHSRAKAETPSNTGAPPPAPDAPLAFADIRLTSLDDPSEGS